jgi:HEAT repeat protein
MTNRLTKIQLAWGRAAQLLGLQGPDNRVGLRLHGRVECFDVLMETFLRRARTWTRVSVRGGKALVVESVAPRRASLFKLLRPAGILTGDQSFDREVVVEGDENALAVLSASTRRALLREMRHGSSVNDATLIRELPRVLRTTRAIVPQVEHSLQLLRRLLRPTDVAHRLAGNALRDPVPAVRIKNLKRLAEGHPESATEVSRALLRDRDPAVRLLAAGLLGTEGEPVLRRLAGNGRIDTSIQAQAIASLGPRLPLARVLSILDTALNRSRRRPALAAIAVLGQHAGPRALARLKGLIEGTDSEYAAAAASGLGATQKPQAEPLLLAALSAAQPALRVAAARALGQVGSLTAVVALHQAVNGHPRDRELRTAATEAISAIHTRFPKAAHGQLSLADAGSGQLALAEREAGTLSLAGEPASSRPRRS